MSDVAHGALLLFAVQGYIIAMNHKITVLLIGLFSLLGVSWALQPTKLAVMDFKSTVANASDMTAFAGVLASELRKIPGVSVTTSDDMNNMLNHEANVRALGCSETDCLVKIGASLGVDYLVTGTLGQVGNRVLFTLTLVYIKAGTVKKSADRVIKGDVGVLVDQLPALAGEIMGAAGPEGMSVIPEGCFEMGSSQGIADESPTHTVCLKGFRSDQKEVSNEQYQFCVQSGQCAPAHFQDGLCKDVSGAAWKGTGAAQEPVVCVDWEQAQAYCTFVGKRLPTEAEWEYMARAGSSSDYFWGESMDGGKAWYAENSGRKIHPSGQKTPNAWGLQDVIGNVAEWTADWYLPTYYAQRVKDDPTGPASGALRVVRGGAFVNYPANLSSSTRGKATPNQAHNFRGMRCVD